MIPASYLSPTQAQSILDTLTQGRGTGQGSNNTYNVLPSLTGGEMTTALTDRILDADLSTVTTISSAGLTPAEVDTLNGIRFRVSDGLASSYADLPKLSPLNDHNTGLPIAAPNQAHAIDVIIQTILFWDPRYFLRLRSNVGTNAENDVYELPGRYNYLSNPMIIATMRLHGFTSNVANVGPTFSRVTSTTPHGYYSGMTIQDMAVVTATTFTTNVTQTTNSVSNIAAIDTFFTSNATPSIVTGNDINVNVPSTANSAYFWGALNNLGSASVEVTGNQLRFYRDVARTDLIRASWGNTTGFDAQGVGGPNERVAINTDGQHLIIPTGPLQVNYISGNSASSVYESKSIDTYNPVTQTFTVSAAGFSIYDGQFVNMTAVTAGGVFDNPAQDLTPQYFDQVNTTQFKLYRTADLASGNVWAFGNTSTISNIAYSSGNTVWQVNFSTAVDYPALVSGQDIRFVNTSGATNFSAAVSLTQNSTGNIQIYPSAANFVHSVVGTVSGQDRLVACTSNNIMVYSNNGKRWFTVASPPSSPVSQLIWAPGAKKFFALSTNTISTSSNGITWTAAHTVAFSSGSPTALMVLPQSADPTLDIIVVVPPTQDDDCVVLRYNKTTGAFSSSGTVPFDPITLDTWYNRAGSNGWIVCYREDGFGTPAATSVQRFSGSSLIVPAAINFASNQQPTDIVVTDNLAVIKNATLVRRFNKQTTFFNASNTITGTKLRQISNTEVHGITNTGSFIITDNSTNTGVFASGNFTVNGTNTMVYSLGYIRGKYVYANAAFSGVTEGYTKATAGLGEIDPAYDDLFTANAHPFTTGQQIRPSTTFNFNGTIKTPPTNLWVEVISVNTLELYEDEQRTIGYGSDRPSGVMTASTITPVFYIKYRSARTWDLYLGSDVTDVANRFTDNTLMTGGTTTGNTVWNGYLTSIADDSDTRIRPLFYPQYRSPTSVSLWVNAAKTIPYAYFGRNGTLLNQETTYTSTGLYLLTGVAHEVVFGSDQVLPNIVVGLNTTPLYYAQVSNDYTINLYSDAALTVPYTQVSWANSAATSWQVNPSYAGSWRLDEFYVPNIGTKSYFTTNLTTNTTTVNASWGLTGQKFYTRFVQEQTIYTAPNLLVNEFSATNAGDYYGHMRFTATSGPGGASNVAVVSGTVYGGLAGPSPAFYTLNAPGRFNTDAPTMLGIEAEPDSGTAPAIDEALAYTGNAWATSSNLTDRDERVWPSTIAPASITWTIEQPNSTLESYNLTRYSRARDVTQYRIRLTYPSMTKVQIAEYTNVIHAARGSHKPMLFTPPVNDLTQQYVTIKVGDKNSTVPVRFRTREAIASGEQIIRVDGLPPSLTLADPAFDAGWAVELPIRNSTGSWGIPIHDVLTNAYGEANMRLNNNIASALPYGVAIGADAAQLDVFIDADSVELKVDIIGRHYLEIDLVTKRIF